MLPAQNCCEIWPKSRIYVRDNARKAKRIPGKEEFYETLRYYSRQLEVTGVDVRLGVYADVAALTAASGPSEGADGGGDGGGFDQIILACLAVFCYILLLGVFIVSALAL